MDAPENHKVDLALEDNPQLCDLCAFSAGNSLFAVLAEEVDATAERKRPATLPNSPPAILGIVCVRGRMLTALDPIALTTGEQFKWPSELPCLVALRGDEQLALAAESLEDTITIAVADIKPAAETDKVVLGKARYGGEEIIVLRAAALFDVAIQRKERRRRRF